MGEFGKRPVPGEFYRHFKGNLYQVKMLAKDSEDGKEMVVYQAMYPPFTYYVRRLEEFVSRVDLGKYPDALQMMRFERVNPAPSSDTEEIQNTGSASGESGFGMFSGAVSFGSSGVSDSYGNVSNTPSQPEMTDEELEYVLCHGNIEKYIHTRISEEDLKRRGMMLFLDADSVRKKRQIFMSIGPYLDQIILNNIAVTLDFVLEEEDRDAQYDAILRCLGAREHYEGGRLR